MARFEDLPNELLEQIIDYTHGDDLVNLATTGRHIHELSQPALERHRELQKRYRKISTHAVSKNFLEQKNFLEPITTDIIKDPLIGLYVTSLRIEGWFTSWTTEDLDPYLPKHERYSETTISILHKAVHDNVHLCEQDKISWLLHIETGDEGPVVALLLLLLPNLHKLYIRTQHALTLQSNDCSCLYTVLESALKKGPSVPPLPRLDSVELESYGDQSFHTLRRFVQLPSLRIMRGCALRARIDEENLMHTSTESVNIKALILRECDIDTTLIASTIECTKSLECFSYSAIHAHVGQWNLQTQPDPYWIRSTLLAHARDTLRFLQFLPHAISVKRIPPNSAHHYLGSLRGFRVLETLSVDFLLLFGSNLLGRHTFGTQLPASLCNLLLCRPFTWFPAEALNRTHRDNEESDEAQEGNRNPSATKKRNETTPKAPVIGAPVLQLALQKLPKEKRQRLPKLSKMMIVGVEEGTVKEILASGLIEEFLTVDTTLSVISRETEEAGDSRLFSAQQRWYYEGMDFSMSL